jgi:hypothetical protein
VRDVQLARFAHEGIYPNALMKPKHVKKYRKLDAEGENLQAEAIQRLGLSARVYHRILKVARAFAGAQETPWSPIHGSDISQETTRSILKRMLVQAGFPQAERLVHDSDLLSRPPGENCYVQRRDMQT